MSNSDLTPRRVTIGITTFRRTQSLDRLLTALPAVITTTSLRSENRWEVLDVVVADDDPDRSAEPIVRQHEAAGLRVRYQHVGSRNVATARNSVIEHASERADRLAVIDDDCKPAADWVFQLLDAERRFGSSFVTAGVSYEPDGPCPVWVTREPFNDPISDYPDGYITTTGSTASALWDLDLLRQHGIRFRQDFGPTGGEDMIFYADLRSRGVSIVHAEFARVTEYRPADRLTLNYQLRMRTWFGNNKTWIARGKGTYSSVGMLKHAVFIELQALRYTVRSLRKGFLAWRWLLSETGQAVGIVAGVAGRKFHHDVLGRGK